MRLYSQDVTIWDKALKNGPSKICEIQTSKNLKRYGLLKQTISLQSFSKLSCKNFVWSIPEYFVSYVTILFFQACFRNGNYHYCVKCDQVRSYFWPVFSCIRTEYGDLRSKSLYSVRIQENTDQKYIRIWSLFTQCILCKSERPVSKVLAFKKLCLLDSIKLMHEKLLQCLQ